MREELREMGYWNADIRRMTPAAAGKILNEHIFHPRALRERPRVDADDAASSQPIILGGRCEAPPSNGTGESNTVSNIIHKPELWPKDVDPFVLPAPIQSGTLAKGISEPRSCSFRMAYCRIGVTLAELVVLS